jgi:hypothetical protein
MRHLTIGEGLAERYFRLNNAIRGPCSAAAFICYVVALGLPTP